MIISYRFKPDEEYFMKKMYLWINNYDLAFSKQATQTISTNKLTNYQLKLNSVWKAYQVFPVKVWYVIGAARNNKKITSKNFSFTWYPSELVGSLLHVKITVPTEYISK